MTFKQLPSLLSVSDGTFVHG